MFEPSLLFCLIGGIVVLLVLVLSSAIRIVPEYERIVVFRLGHSQGSRGPVWFC